MAQFGFHMHATFNQTVDKQEIKQQSNNRIISNNFNSWCKLTRRFNSEIGFDLFS